MMTTAFVTLLLAAVAAGWAVTYRLSCLRKQRLESVVHELAVARDELRECSIRKNNAHAEIRSLKTTIERLTGNHGPDSIGWLKDALRHARDLTAQMEARATETIEALKKHVVERGEQTERALAQLHQCKEELGQARRASVESSAKALAHVAELDSKLKTADYNRAQMAKKVDAQHEEIRYLNDRIKVVEGELQASQVAHADAHQGKKVTEEGLVNLHRLVSSKDAEIEALVNQRGFLAQELRGAVNDRDWALDRVGKLESAVVKHRDARGHARCFKNDLELYAAVNPDWPVVDPCGEQSLPELMAGCAAYWLGQIGLENLVPDKMEVDKREVMS
jgi:chromosome segregation ATPase